MAVAWYDVGFFVGILCVTVGLSLWSVPFAVVVFGLLLCAVSLRAADRDRAKQSVPPATIEDHGSTDRIAA